jgi:feruloyl esterase
MFYTMTSAFLYLLISAPSFCIAASSSFEQRCLTFQPEKIVAGATRNALQYLPANATLLLPDNDITCNRAKQAILANVCRVVLSVRTSEQSSIVLEAWLPDVWTGRFLATGNGGIDGCKYLLPCPFKSIAP